MPATEQTSLRKAALTLHALPDHDRQRVWARLDGGRREALAPLLDELVSLGIPRGRQWVPDDEQMPAETGPQAFVWQQPPGVMAALLKTQSIDTAATVMRIASWPWLDEVVATWPPEQRHVLRARLEQARAVPPKLASDLLIRVADTLRARALDVDHTPPHMKRRTVSPAKRSWYHAVMSLFMLT